MIINFVPDKSPDDELFLNLKNKSVNQKFIYFDSGASGYYSNEFYQPVSDKFINFASSQISGINYQKENLLAKVTDKETAFISLGCGNSFEESKILKNFQSNVTFFAIDSSAEMLELSEKILADFNFNKVLIQADFTTKSFQHELSKLVENFDRRIFYISGFTFGNFTSDIISVISNLMNSGDLLVFYVVTVVDLHLYYDIFIKDSKDTLKNKGKMQAYFEPLKKFKITKSRGKIIIDYRKETDIGAFCLQYCFQFSKKTIIEHNNESIEFLAGEKVKAQTIRVYDYESLIACFKTCGFNLLGLEVSDNINVIYSFQKA